MAPSRLPLARPLQLESDGTCPSGSGCGTGQSRRRFLKGPFGEGTHARVLPKLKTPRIYATIFRRSPNSLFKNVGLTTDQARGPQNHQKLSPPWPSGYKCRIPTLVPVVRARFEPRCGQPHFAPTCNGMRNGMRVCGRNCTEAREREWAEGTVSSLPGTLNFRMKFCHSTGIARSGGGVRASTTSYA